MLLLWASMTPPHPPPREPMPPPRPPTHRAAANLGPVKEEKKAIPAAAMSYKAWDLSDNEAAPATSLGHPAQQNAALLALHQCQIFGVLLSVLNQALLYCFGIRGWNGQRAPRCLSSRSRPVISSAVAWWIYVRCRKRPLRLDGVQAQPRRPLSTASATTFLAPRMAATPLQLDDGIVRGMAIGVVFADYRHTHSKEFLSKELNIGEGKDVDLPDCSRTRLKKQCIRYLGPETGVYPYGQVQSTDEDPPYDPEMRYAFFYVNQKCRPMSKCMELVMY